MAHVNKNFVERNLGNKIVIIGSPGAGKTTFALQLGKILKSPVLHLDHYFWLPGWKEKSRRTRREILKKLVRQEQWIIEGTYLCSSKPRLKKADTIIFLDIPTPLCLLRIICRHFIDRRQPRPDLPEGCSDKLDWKRVRKVLSFRVRDHKELSQKLHDYESTKQVIWLRSAKEVEDFLMQQQRDTKELYNGQLIASHSHPLLKAIERTLARSIAPLHSEIWYQALLASEQVPALHATENIPQHDH